MSLRTWSEVPLAVVPLEEDCDPIDDCEPEACESDDCEPVEDPVEDCAPVVLDCASGVATLPLCGVVDEVAPGVVLAAPVLDCADCESIVELPVEEPACGVLLAEASGVAVLLAPVLPVLVLL